MYCPKCAVPLSDDQKFCRSCGLDLQVISQLLISESWTDEPDESESRTSDRSQSRKAKLRIWGTIVLMFGLLVGCLIPISLGLLSNWAGLNQLILVLSGLAGFLLFAGIIPLIYADALPGTQDDGESSHRTALHQPKQTNKLPPDGRSELVPDFAERTTDLLKTAETKGSWKRS